MLWRLCNHLAMGNWYFILLFVLPLLLRKPARNPNATLNSQELQTRTFEIKLQSLTTSFSRVGSLSNAGRSKHVPQPSNSSTFRLSKDFSLERENHLPDLHFIARIRRRRLAGGCKASTTSSFSSFSPKNSINFLRWFLFL